MRRPPSSYGSMKSDSEVEEDGDEERDSGEEEKIVDEEECAALPEFRIPEATGYCVFVLYSDFVLMRSCLDQLSLNCMRVMLLLG